MKRKPKKVFLTKYQISRIERERRRKIFALLLGILSIIAVLALLGFGYYDSQLSPRWQPVIRVNDTFFTASYLVKELKFAKALGSNPYMIEPLIEEIQNFELIRQGAKRLGISLTPEEIEKHIRSTFLSSEEKEEAKFKELYQRRLKELGISDQDYRSKIRDLLLSEKLSEFLRAQIPSETEQVHLFAILVSGEERAKELKARLEAGEDFSALAREFSEDKVSKERGGELGWLPKGVRPEFDEVAFRLEIGKISDPIPTSEGFYILKVADKGIRAIDEENIRILKANALSNWLVEERKKSRVESYLTPKIIRWIYGQIR